jgi:pimeloyl-ACP methyl ester carboxylesterase
MGDDSDRETFEQRRLALFSRHGLEATGDWLVDRSGRRTAAVVGGAGETTTLLIHGAISDAGEWALVAPHLEGRVVAVDWPGSGLTPPVDVRRMGIRKFALEWLDSVIEAIGAPVRIIGSSAGGNLALLYALARLRRALADRNREIPEGVNDLLSLYLLWDLSLPPKRIEEKWTSIRVSPQQAIELGRVHGTLNAAFGANRSDIFGLGLALLAAYLEGAQLQTTALTLAELRHKIINNYL